jgi:hypothetical protein
MPTPARRGSRGPAPNPDRGTPSGYRVTARQRHELEMAKLFLGTKSLQETIDVAVQELLKRLRTEPGFEDALRAAEASRRREAGNVRDLPKKIE